MFKNAYVNNVLTALAVALLSFALLNVTFMFNWLVFSLINLIYPVGFTDAAMWFASFRHIIFLFLIALISWFVFKSGLKEFYKVVFLAVPTAVGFVTLGMFLYQWPALIYTSGALALGGIVCCFYRSKKSWLYYYSVFLVAGTLLIMGLAGIDI